MKIQMFLIDIEAMTIPQITEIMKGILFMQVPYPISIPEEMNNNDEISFVLVLLFINPCFNPYKYNYTENEIDKKDCSAGKIRLYYK